MATSYPTPPTGIVLSASERQDKHYQAAVNIGGTVLEQESSLIVRKWHDYRFLNVVDTTIYFTKLYRHIYQVQAHKTCYPDRAGIHHAELFELDPQTRTSMWRARQVADMLGVPYDFFIRRAMEYTRKRLHVNLPMPNQLYSQEIIGEVTQLWRKEQEIPTYGVTDPRFRNELYCGHPLQDSYHDWVVARIMKRGRNMWDIAIGNYCYTAGLLTEERARQEFGEEALVKGRRCGYPESRDPMPPGLTVNDVIPGCFGLPHASNSPGSVCDGCTHQKPCATEALAVVGRVRVDKGVVDPVKERKRKIDRDRQRRHRARKKGILIPPTMDDVIREWRQRHRVRR